MLKLKCLEKIRNNNGRIIGYRLEDAFGTVREIQPKPLKEAIIQGKVEVINLAMSTDGKIIDKITPTKQQKIYVETPIERFLLKCRMAGININDYEFNDDFTVLKKYKGTDKRIIIPPVKKIASECIESRYNYNMGRGIEIDEIILPDSVEELEERAFIYCTARRIKLNNGLKKIGNAALSETYNLEELEIPDSVEEIGDSALRCSAISRLKIGKKVTEIPEYMCYYCTKLEGVDIPSTVGYIGTGAFRQCTNLRYVHLKEGLKNILSSAFADCKKLREIIIPSTVDMIGPWAFSLSGVQKEDEKDEVSIKILSSKARLKSECFSSRKISQISFNGTISSIAKRVFNGCTIRSDVRLPEIDTSDNYEISTEALFENATVPSVYFADGYDVGARIFFGARVHKVVLSKSVRKLSKLSFSHAMIDELVLPEVIEYVGSKAFEMSRIGNIHIPNGVLYIGDGAFNGAGLKGDITLSGDMHIGTGAFTHNEIDKVILTDDFECFTIGSGALAMCCNKFEVSEKHELYSVIGKLLCNKNKDTIYACAKTEIKKIEIPKYIKRITDYAFAGIETLTDIEIRHIISLGHGAFAYCSKLRRVILAKGYEHDGNAFKCSFKDNVNIEFVDPQY